MSTPERDILYLSKKQLFGSWKWRRAAHPLYLKACYFFGATLIDRTQSLDAGIDYKVLEPLGTIEPNQLTFSQVCEVRAQQLADLPGQRMVRVLWSGGIDSTVALTALIKVFMERNELVRLAVLLSKESISEFPSFYEEVIRPHMDYRLMEGTIYDCIDHREVNVTGEHGDQLFGSDKLKNHVISRDAFRPFMEVLPYAISRKLATEKYTDSLIDYLLPQLEKAPIDIHTYYDFMWWLNFSMKWQNVSLRLLHGLDKQYEQLNQSVFHFFQSHAFQSWSVANHHIKIKNTWPSYKYIAKEYIHSFHADQHYFQHKEKEPSLKQVIVRETGLANKLNPIRFIKRIAS